MSIEIQSRPGVSIDPVSEKFAPTNSAAEIAALDAELSVKFPLLHELGAVTAAGIFRQEMLEARHRFIGASSLTS